MGFMTEVLILNDGLDYIKNDPNFVENLYHAICRMSYDKSIDVPAGNHANPCTVVAMHHADQSVPLLFHGNCGVRMDEVHKFPEIEAYIIRALKWCAEQHGYRLAKKPLPKIK